MGVNHLIKLREFLKNNKKNQYSRTYLRGELNQNFVTIQQNLQYLVNEEKKVKITNKDKELYQWKE